MTDHFDSDVRRNVMYPELHRDQHNTRARDCRRCGSNMPKGTGTLMKYWAGMGHHIETYLCPDCLPVVEQMRNQEVGSNGPDNQLRRSA